ncbi:TonB-dependent receptor [Flavobacterium branchiophilum NBRC 15030 = ATCC 35035]|nr:TonB-dependent receptor [Flavobacterium branchiophilum NBRC 15030 = ATCC 35035]
MLYSANYCYAQSQTGKVVDEDKNPINAVQIKFDNDSTFITKEDGLFLIDKKDIKEIDIYKENYKNIIISFDDLKKQKFVVMLKKAKTNSLEEVVLKAKDPISEKFSVSKLSKLDIYTNPSSKGDPLLAITSLPSSTNTNETANPTLRGGEADRSRVILNGVPINNPVRNSQDNGLGSFSLFNTEFIHKQYVYASNPPLTYGNSSAGIVEIETIRKLDNNSTKLTFNLSNMGFFVSKKIKGNFIQFYGNKQFSDAFILLNKNSVPNLKDFRSNDFGLNLRVNINKKVYWNSYNYFVDESILTNNFQYNFSGESKGSQDRFLTVNNFDFIINKSKLRVANLLDYSDKKYSYGVINSKSKSLQIFTSIDYKLMFNKSFSIQTGSNFSLTNYNYDEIKPVYYFSLNENAPTYLSSLRIKNNYIESYLYANWEMTSKLGFSTGVRTNVPIDNQREYLSYQASTHFDLNNKNRMIISAGKYHSYSTPNYINHTINLLNSNQIALDYYYSNKKFDLTSAIYYKNDSGDFTYSQTQFYQRIKSFGWEVSTSFNINKKLSFLFSNTFLNQKLKIDSEYFNGNSSFNYFIKARFSYSNMRLLNVSLSLSSRPGNYYTPVVSSIYNNDALNYQPFFSSNINDNQLNEYNKLDFVANKIVTINKKNLLIPYLSIQNILNKNNQSYIYYNANYTIQNIYNFQKRIVYFGMQYTF